MIDINSSLQEQTVFFKQRNIDTSIVGFYDDPRFIDIERQNAEFLNCYASFVKRSAYSQEYIDTTRIVITKVVSYLSDELKTENSTGRCVEVSMVLSRILEKFGIWNYIIKGSLTISFPEQLKIPKAYFWSVSRSRIDAGHAWIVAPPFGIIDLTLKHQKYSYGIGALLPDYILAENTTKDILLAEDVLDGDLLKILQPQKLSNSEILDEIVPHVVAFSGVFHPESFLMNDIGFKYTHTAIGAPDMSLEDLPKSINNKLAIDLYKEIARSL